MKTSSNDTVLIERYVQGTLDTGSKLVVEARMITDSVFASDVLSHRKVEELVRLHGRKTLRNELDRIHHHLFHHPSKTSFRERVFQIFKKQ